VDRRLPALVRRRRGLRARVARLRSRRTAPAPYEADDATAESLQRELQAKLAGQAVALEELRRSLARERDARERAELAHAAEVAAAEERAVERAHEQALRRHQVFGPPERLTIAGSAEVHDALFNTVSGRVTVGDDAFFGHGVAVLTGTHDTTKTGGDRKVAIPDEGRDISIGDGAWIASRATIIGPCRIGAHAVVAAGAVVAGDVPDGATVAGVPARIVRRPG
jgi:acetyltransferase-like isoleucine patch superfamily enzyme